MRTIDVLNTIDQQLEQNKTSRIYFKNNKSPLHGKFIKSHDADELLSKGMIRFVKGKFMDLWEATHSPVYSCILTLNNFLLIKLYDEN